MNDKKNIQGEIGMKDGSIAMHNISWLFGMVAFAIGVVNTYWGNYPYFGIFILVFSLVYFLPVYVLLPKMTGFNIPKMGMISILLGIFIIWAAMGVVELFVKIELIRHDL